MFVRYAKEDFDSDDRERKRLVIKQLGADLKLSGRTAPEQMKKDLKEDLILSWCARLDLNQHAERHMLLRHTCIPISPLAQQFHYNKSPSKNIIVMLK